MASPLVSVLVPVRDEGPFLAAALESLSAQTLGQFEAVVVDDGSSDPSLAIARAHARHDPRFRVVDAGRVGLVGALERARAAARAPLVARMDGDDLALPRRLEVQVAALREEALDACGGGVRYFPDAAVTDGSRRYERWVNGLVTVEAARRDVFVECAIPNPTLVVRRELLDALGGWRDCGWPEDYDLLLRLWALGARFRNVEEVVLRWRQHPARITRVDAAYSLEAFLRCRVHHLRRTLLGGFGGVVVWGAGRVGKAFARELVRQDGTLRAFVDVDPRKVGQAVHGVPVVGVGDAPGFGDAFAVGAVAGGEARARIRELVAAQAAATGSTSSPSPSSAPPRGPPCLSRPCPGSDPRPWPQGSGRADVSWRVCGRVGGVRGRRGRVRGLTPAVAGPARRSAASACVAGATVDVSWRRGRAHLPGLR